MLQLPRALIVDDERAFANVIAGSLRECSREIAIRIEPSLDGAILALEEYRPHIVFLSWGLRSKNSSAITVLHRLVDFMAADPSFYDYPLVVNTNCDAEFQKNWDEMGITFHFDNPKVVINKADWQNEGSTVIKKFLRTKGPKRLLRLSKADVPLSQCAYLRISDNPLRMHYWDTHRNEEVSLLRHRVDTFDLIEKQLIPDKIQNADATSVPSLFVSANKRNGWVNLAFVKEISFDKDGERIFVFDGTTEPPFRLSNSLAVGVTKHLERLKQMTYWDNLSQISVPD